MTKRSQMRCEAQKRPLATQPPEAPLSGAGGAFLWTREVF